MFGITLWLNCSYFEFALLKCPGHCSCPGCFLMFIIVILLFCFNQFRSNCMISSSRVSLRDRR